MQVSPRGGAGSSESKLYRIGKTLRKLGKKKEARWFISLCIGINIDDMTERLSKENKVLVIIGAEKVPHEVFELADFNISISNQPHSEIAALAIFLDRIFRGKQFKNTFLSAPS